MRCGIVDQYRFQRLKEQTRQGAGTFRTDSVACIAPQFLQHQFRARHVVAAQQAAFKLGHQQRARFRAEVPEIFPQTLDEKPVGHTHHSPLAPGTEVIARRP